MGAHGNLISPSRNHVKFVKAYFTMADFQDWCAAILAAVEDPACITGVYFDDGMLQIRPAHAAAPWNLQISGADGVLFMCASADRIPAVQRHSAWKAHPLRIDGVGEGLLSSLGALIGARSAKDAVDTLDAMHIIRHLRTPEVRCWLDDGFCDDIRMHVEERCLRDAPFLLKVMEMGIDPGPLHDSIMSRCMTDARFLSQLMDAGIINVHLDKMLLRAARCSRDDVCYALIDRGASVKAVCRQNSDLRWRLDALLRDRPRFTGQVRVLHAAVG
jgi:hypothetical protein